MERKVHNFTERQKWLFKNLDGYYLLIDKYGHEHWAKIDTASIPGDYMRTVIKGSKFLENYPKGPRKWRSWQSSGKKYF